MIKTGVLFTVATLGVFGQNAATVQVFRRVPAAVEVAWQDASITMQALQLSNQVHLSAAMALQSEVAARKVSEATLKIYVVSREDLVSKADLLEDVLAATQKQQGRARGLPDSNRQAYSQSLQIGRDAINSCRQKVGELQSTLQQAWKLVYGKNLPADPLSAPEFLRPSPIHSSANKRPPV